MTHMGTILSLYLKTGISLCLESRLMLIIINLTKVFTKGKNVELDIFCIYKIKV